MPDVSETRDDYYDDDPYFDSCPECGDGDYELARSACPDDLCHGGEVPCMHGDYSVLRCSLCGK